MKLRNIILSAIALALAASFTACDKDDDKDEPKSEEQTSDNNINLYQAWEIPVSDYEKGVTTRRFYVFIKDSMAMGLYNVPSAWSASEYGLSTDSAYLYEEEDYSRISDVVCTPDSATATVYLCADYDSKVTVRKTDSCYLLTIVDLTRNRTIYSYKVTPAGKINWTNRMD